ncbi:MULTISPECIES: potassium/proton antiporter [unclassified Serinicoccus]|uniref:potassium/proton antiporter n=1 Tax=unclassified Serinicoccus TaxID=2643101 RepID=UPI00385445E3
MSLIVDNLDLTIVVGSLVLLVAVAAVRLSTRLGLPTLLIYLGLGLVLGEAGLGLRFDDAELSQAIGLFLLAIILAEGGLTTRWSVIRPVLGQSLVLATLGVLVSVAVTSGITFLLLDVDLRTALLLGAIVSSTDAAAVFSVLRRLPVSPRLGATLEAESGFNDAPVVILVALLVADGWDQNNVVVTGGQILFQLVAGVAVGLLVAWVASQALRRVVLPAVGLYPIATIAMTLLAYGTAGLLGASSFMAVYVAAVRLGNARLPHADDTRGFAEALAWLAQIGLFVLLGLLASPGRLLEAVLPALIVGSGLLLVARPLSVLVTMSPFRMPWRSQAFLSWAGLRGAVPIVLATLPISAGLESATEIFDIVFVLVVVFTLVQAPALPWLARRLRVEHSASADGDLGSGESEAGFLRYRLPQELVARATIFELGLPPAASVSMVVRDGTTFTPSQHSVLEPGDRLVVLAPSAQHRAVERCLQDLAGGLAEGELVTLDGPG